MKPFLSIWQRTWHATPLITALQCFFASLFTIDRKWKQLKYPLTYERRVKNMVHTHIRILFSCKEKWNNEDCTQMDKPQKYYIERGTPIPRQMPQILSHLKFLVPKNFSSNDDHHRKSQLYPMQKSTDWSQELQPQWIQLHHSSRIYVWENSAKEDVEGI